MWCLWSLGPFWKFENFIIKSIHFHSIGGQIIFGSWLPETWQILNEISGGQQSHDNSCLYVPEARAPVGRINRDWTQSNQTQHIHIRQKKLQTKLSYIIIKQSSSHCIWQLAFFWQKLRMADVGSESVRSSICNECQNIYINKSHFPVQIDYRKFRKWKYQQDLNENLDIFIFTFRIEISRNVDQWGHLELGTYTYAHSQPRDHHDVKSYY